jgi:hypothetical protein
MWHDESVLRLVLLAPLFAPPVTKAQPETPPATAPAETYDLAAAQADVETILVDRGKAYLDARARLESHPALAAEAVVARLDAVPPPGPEKRDRLLNVLASLGRPEDLAMFGDQLRRAMLQDRPTELWMQLLRKQGPAATDVLIGLVGDRELKNEQRAVLLEMLVELTAADRLGELMAMVGRGADELQDTLRRALIRRARERADDRTKIASGIDAAIDGEGPDEARLAQLLILRAACCDLDEGFGQRLESLASSADAAFQVRVASIDGLARHGLGAAVLEALVRERARSALDGSQADEILVALALEAVPADRAASLVSEFDLAQAEAPRLAQLGWRFAKLATDHSWLTQSQAHAWPEVRKQALARVAEGGSCSKDTLEALTEIAGPISQGGEKDARVGRAAVGAIGRCGGEPAFDRLRELLEDTAVDITQRAEAARQLAEHDPKGADYVAELLLDNAYPDLARELVSALGHAAEPSEAVRDALCTVGRANPMVASTAHESLSKLFPGEGCE